MPYVTSSGETSYCPNCPPVFRKTKPDQQIGQALTIIEQNYSGCSVDIATCPVCKKTFEISFVIDEIVEIDR